MAVHDWYILIPEMRDQYEADRYAAQTIEVPVAFSGTCDAMTILVLSRQHPFAGTSCSRRRIRFIPVPARAKSPPMEPQHG
jgi:hypothetical protein